MSQQTPLNRVPPPSDAPAPVVRPPDWPPEWVPISSISEQSRNTPVPLFDQPLSGQESQSIVIFTKSVYINLLHQLYSDSLYDVMGYLGGRWETVPVRREGREQWKLVCFVEKFTVSERLVPEMVQGRSVEDPKAVRKAVERLAGPNLECVGWYRSTNSARPLQPTCHDIAKQAFLQTLIPDGIGLLLSVASANNPNNLQRHIPRSHPMSPLHAPAHGLLAYKAGLQMSDGVLKFEDIYPPYPEDNPGPFFHDPAYNSDLAAMKIPVGIYEEPYISLDIQRETHRSLYHTLTESRTIYLAQASESGTETARRMFLDSDYDNFLMEFWRRSAVSASNALDQDLLLVKARTNWVENSIGQKLKELQGWYEEAVRDRIVTEQRGVKRKSPERDGNAMDVDEPTAPPVKDFEAVLMELRERADEQAKADQKANRALVTTVEELTVLLDTPLVQPFKIPRVQPTPGRIRELALFEEEYDSIKDKQKKRAAGKKGAATRMSRAQKQKHGSSAAGGVKEKGKGKEGEVGSPVENSSVPRRRTTSGVAVLGTDGAAKEELNVEQMEARRLLNRSMELLQQSATHLRPEDNISAGRGRPTSGSSNMPRSRRTSKEVVSTEAMMVASSRSRPLTAPPITSTTTIRQTSTTASVTDPYYTSRRPSATAPQPQPQPQPHAHVYPYTTHHPHPPFISSTIAPLAFLGHGFGYPTGAPPPDSTTAGNSSTTRQPTPQPSRFIPASNTSTPMINSYIARRASLTGARESPPSSVVGVGVGRGRYPPPFVGVGYESQGEVRYVPVQMPGRGFAGGFVGRGERGGSLPPPPPPPPPPPSTQTQGQKSQQNGPAQGILDDRVTLPSFRNLMDHLKTLETGQRGGRSGSSGGGSSSGAGTGQQREGGEGKEGA